MNACRLDISAKELDKLLDQLDANGIPANAPGAGPVYPYRMRPLRVDVRRAGQRPAVLSLAARALGAKWMSLVTATRVTAGTPCLVYLITIDGAWEPVPGRIASTRRLDANARLWEVHVTFDAPVDVVQYAAAAWRARVLVADDSRTVRELLPQMLAKHHADTIVVSNGRAAVEAATERFDLILLDVEMPELTGVEVVTKLRGDSYIWPIAVITAISDEENRYACMEAGCDAFLSKPPEADEIGHLVRFAKPRPQFSALLGDKNVHNLVNNYVTQLREQVQQIEAAFRTGQSQTLLSLARQIRADAPACGFPALAPLAHRVEVTVSSGFPASDLRRVLCRLLCHCLATRPIGEADGSPAEPGRCPQRQVSPASANG